MTPDPNREWYVYFKEKEMGPFLELDLQKKISLGELDQTAFVFTEGMSDWTAVDELEFLTTEEANKKPAVQAILQPEGVQETQVPEQKMEALSQTVATRSLNVEKLGSEEESELEKRIEASSKVDPGQKNRTLLRWLAFGFVMLFVVGVGVEYLNMAPAMKRGLLSRFTGELSEPQIVTPEMHQESSSVQTSLTPSKESKIWEELNKFRASTDGQSPTFRIASEVLSDGRPIVVGALSPLLNTPRVHIVVYPDLTRSLMADPVVWWFDPVLVDGYFVIGPLNVDGAVLPAGTYKLVLQGMGRFLGMVSFDVGQYPAGPELDVQMKLIQNQRILSANQERSDLEKIFAEFNVLFESLKSDSLKLAIKEAEQKAAWDRVMAAWTEGFAKTSSELNAMRGFTYFKNVQDRMEAFSREMLRVQGLMDLFNKSGRAAFERRAARRYTELWTAFENERDFLRTDIQALANVNEFSPTIDEELLKTRLMERK